MGNPRLSSMVVPAYFEIALDQSAALPRLSASDGSTIKIPLNVSIQSINIRSQQIVTRTPTATGLMMTFWGSQPDTITGRGSSGLFLNAFGLTALMSNRLSPIASSLYEAIVQAYPGDSYPKDPGAGDNQLGSLTPNQLRIAAQDAFAELLLLFKNNGIIRFTPQKPENNTKRVQWSPSEGSTGYQMAARTGDVRRRGYVVFRYKGASYLGNFKSFNFSADAANPFQWTFDFVFRVSRSVMPVYYPGGPG